MPNRFEALCAALNHFDLGFLVVFPDGRIVYANLRAREMMAGGWPIQSHNGALQGCSKKATAVLLESLRRLTEAPPEENCLDVCLSDAASPKGAAIAAVKRLTSAEPGPSLLALFVTDLGSRSECSLSVIADCFGLTPAEARTLHCVVESGGLAEAALALDLSENTVKTHLQNIYTKTGSSRQGQLIKLVNDLRPPLRFEAKCEGSGDKGPIRFSTRSCHSHSASVRL